MPRRTPEQVAQLVERAYREMISQPPSEQRAKWYLTAMYTIGQTDQSKAYAHGSLIEKLNPVTGEPIDTYLSAKDAARSVDRDSRSIFRALEHGYKCGGYRFRYKDLTS